MATKPNTTKRTAIKPDAIIPAGSIAPYDPPAEYVPTFTDDMTVSAIRQLAESAIGHYSGQLRRFMRDTVAVWTAVGASIDAIARKVGGGKEGGEPLASDEVPTWPQVRRALHWSPDVAKQPNATGATEAVIAGWGEGTLKRAWDAYRSDALGNYNTWAALCESADVVKSSPRSFKSNNGSSLVAWSLAKADGRVAPDGRVIAGGSNRFGTGAGMPRELQRPNAETDRLTEAEVDAARTAQTEAEHTERVDILTGDAKAKVAGRVTVGALTSLSDEGLAKLALFIKSEQRRRREASDTPVVDAGAAAATEAGAKRKGGKTAAA